MPRPPTTARSSCATRPVCSPGSAPIGTRHDPQPHLEQAVDHGHRHRRPERGERLQHPDARASGSRQRARRARAGRPRGLRGARGAPPRAHARSARSSSSATSTRRAVPRRHQRLGGVGDPGCDARGVRGGRGRDGVGRLDPVHRRPRARVPGRADPRHGRRGSRTRAPTARTSRCTWRPSSTRSSPRRFSLAAPECTPDGTSA